MWSSYKSSVGAVFFWLLLYLLGAYLYFELLWQFSGEPQDWKIPHDVEIYRKYGQAILAGKLPYRGFFVEYPPGSLPAFVLPALFTTGQGAYTTFFASEMAIILTATLMLTAYTAHVLGGRWWPFSAAVFTGASLLLSKLVLFRFDAVVALTFAAAAALASRSALSRSSKGSAVALPMAWAFLGFGAAAKFVPAVAALPLALLANQSGGTRQNIRILGERARSVTGGLVVFFGVVAAFLLPALWFGGEGFIKSLMYHTGRGLHMESLASSVLLKLGWINEVVHEYGAHDVRGWGVEFLASMSLPMTGALLGVTAAVMYREHRKGRFGLGEFPRFAAAFVLALLIGFKVLSPQYIIWLLPLVPLSASSTSGRRLWGIGVSLVFLALCYATNLEHYYLVLSNYDPFDPSAVNSLLVRNLLLVFLWALMLYLPTSSKQEVKTRREEPRPNGEEQSLKHLQRG